MLGWFAKKLLPSQQIMGLVQCGLEMATHYEIYTRIIEGGFVHGIRRKPDALMIDIDGDGRPDQ